jgi:hypothetical protein
MTFQLICMWKDVFITGNWNTFKKCKIQLCWRKKVEEILPNNLQQLIMNVPAKQECSLIDIFYRPILKHVI